MNNFMLLHIISFFNEYALKVLTSGVSYELEVTYEEYSERILDGLLLLKSCYPESLSIQKLPYLMFESRYQNWISIWYV